MRLRSAAVVATAMACLLAQRDARAQLAQETVRGKPRTAALSWVRAPGAESCAGAQELAQQVEAEIGPVFVPPSDAELSIEGLVIAQRATPGGYLVRIGVSSSEGAVLGTRELRSADPDCKALTDAAALVIALAVDRESAFTGLPQSLGFDSGEDPAEVLLAELVAEQQAAEEKASDESDAARMGAGRQDGERASPTSTKPAEADENAQESERERSLLELDLGAAVAVGVLPAPAIGPVLGLTFTGEPLRVPVGVRLRYFPSQDVAANDGGNSVASVGLGQLTLLVCPLDLGSSWTATLCAGGQAGLVLASGDAFAENHRSQAFNWSATLDFRARFALIGPASLRVGAGAQLALTTYRLTAQATDGSSLTLHTSPRVGGWLELGLVLAF